MYPYGRLYFALNCVNKSIDRARATHDKTLPISDRASSDLLCLSSIVLLFLSLHRSITEIKLQCQIFPIFAFVVQEFRVFILDADTSPPNMPDLTVEQRRVVRAENLRETAEKAEAIRLKVSDSLKSGETPLTTWS